jgi:predicted transcriptional regulator
MLIKEIMKKPYVIEKDISIKDASKLMATRDISSLIIINKDKIKGIITHEDIVENFSEKKKVSSVMSKKVIFIKENDSIQKAVELIKENKISVLPVLDEKGHLIGVIDAKDIINEAFEGDDFLIN